MTRTWAGLSAALALWLGAGSSALGAPVDPHGVFVAGDRILAVDKAQQLWRRGLQPQDVWSTVQLEGEAKGAPISSLTCAGDGSGKCVITTGGDRPRYLIYDTGSGAQETLDWPKADPALFLNKNEIYYFGEAAGVRTLYLYKTGDKSSVSLGDVAANEIVRFFGIDGVVRPIAIANTGVARALRPGADSLPVSMPYTDSMITSEARIIMPEEWVNDRPATVGRQTIHILELGTADPATGRIGTRGGLLTSLATEKSALAPQTLRTDANHDFVGQFASAQGRSVGLYCNMENGRGFVDFMKPPADALVEIYGSEMGPGFIIRGGSLLSSGAYRYVSFPAAEQGYRTRKCADLKLNNFDLGITPRTVAADFETVRGVATTPEGVQTPYTVFKAKGATPRHLIIDVYGAYGTLIGRGPFPDDVLAELKRTGTAVVFPIVRGDGNLGYERGISSRTPNRLRAVQDVVAVAERLKVQYPDIKPLIRGRSAGGWLAVRSALERPDLFSGVVGLSGAYKVAGLQGITTGDQRFFSPEDDLGLLGDRIKAACPKLKLRFVHAKDDWKLPYADVEAFASLFKDAGCSVEMVAFDTGGHQIDIPLDRPEDGKRRLHAYYDPFVP